MKKVVVLTLLIALCVILTGCSTKYILYLTGFKVNPDPAYVNQPVSILLYFRGNVEGSIVTQYHWKVEDYDEEFVTPGNLLYGIKFSTPGFKYVHVTVEADYKNFVSNEINFVVNVKEVPKE